MSALSPELNWKCSSSDNLELAECLQSSVWYLFHIFVLTRGSKINSKIQFWIVRRHFSQLLNVLPRFTPFVNNHFYAIFNHLFVFFSVFSCAGTAFKRKFCGIETKTIAFRFVQQTNWMETNCTIQIKINITKWMEILLQHEHQPHHQCTMETMVTLTIITRRMASMQTATTASMAAQIASIWMEMVLLQHRLLCYANDINIRRSWPLSMNHKESNSAVRSKMNLSVFSHVFLVAIFTSSIYIFHFDFQFYHFADRSNSDIQQIPRRHMYNNNISPSPRRRPMVATPTRV